jgi:hypothetical protein
MEANHAYADGRDARTHAHIHMEEGSSTLVMSKVSTLCEDLIEDDGILLDLDDHFGHLKPVVKEKKTRTKKVYDTISVQKRNRRRIKKTVFMMQNLKGLN